MTIESALLLFGVGLIAGLMNVSSGGGSALTLPALIFILDSMYGNGVNTALANGTNRVAIFVQNVSAIYSFKKEKYEQFNLSLKLALFTLPGAIIGAFVAIKISDNVFEIILGIIMIGIIISMLIPNKKLTQTNDDNQKITLFPALAMLGIGFYGGFVQVGVGFLLMAALHYLMRFNLVIVNMHKVFIVFIYTIPALLVFVISGNVDWLLGLTLAAGNAIGGWWAVKFQVKKGEKYIKWLLVIAITIIAGKLLIKNIPMVF